MRCCAYLRTTSAAAGIASLWVGLVPVQSLAQPCAQPLCVSRTGDQPDNPEPGTLRYAVSHAPAGSTITFDRALDGRVIALNARSPGNHIQITRDLTIQGPGAKLLTISGGGGTRIFLVAGAVVQINSVTLADGLAKGSDGVVGAGGAGGGGGAAGMGGAIFLHGGSVTLSGVVLRNNRAVGGSGGGGGASVAAGAGGPGGECGGLPEAARDRRGAGESGGPTGNSARQDGDWGCGGGGGGLLFNAGVGMGGPGGIGGFGGGDGGSGGFLDSEGSGRGGNGGTGGAGLGGAIFVSSGHLQVADTVFKNNGSTGGAGAGGAATGPAKGGALFVCSAFFCGPNHGGVATSLGGVSFDSNVAAEAGVETCCKGRDDADVCGYLSSPVPTRFSILAPPVVPPGLPFRLKVAALDSNDSPVFTYMGTVQIASTDAESVLPSPVVLSDGVATFPVTLNALGKQTITVTDVADKSITGTSNAITVDHIDPALVPGTGGPP